MQLILNNSGMESDGGNLMVSRSQSLSLRKPFNGNKEMVNTVEQKKFFLFSRNLFFFACVSFACSGCMKLFFPFK